MKLTLQDLHRQIGGKTPNSAELSPIPQATEPDHFPTSALRPAPTRPIEPIESVECAWPWLRWAYLAAAVLTVVASYLCDHLP